MSTVREGKRDARYYGRTVLGISMLIVLLPLLLVVLPPLGLYYWCKGAVLKRQFRRAWGGRGKVAVFVYSDSPNWKEYIEATILPRVADRVVIVNWSQRTEWQKNMPVEVRVFRHWSGYRAFNPMAIVFPSRGRVRTIRFWNAFRDYKHGKVESLKKQEQLLFDSIGAA